MPERKPQTVTVRFQAGDLERLDRLVEAGEAKLQAERRWHWYGKHRYGRSDAIRDAIKAAFERLPDPPKET